VVKKTIARPRFGLSLSFVYFVSFVVPPSVVAVLVVGLKSAPIRAIRG
jgi:hypothetical protein